MAIRYRTFRNTDPPALVRVWNETFTGRSAVPVRTPAWLEHFIFAKSYFDPAGLIVAEDGGMPIGWALTGFGPDATGQRLDQTTGVLCLLGVSPSHQRGGVASELLRLSEDYVRGKGGTTMLAGPLGPRNPFTFGLYGGADSAGFLQSDTNAGPLLTRAGYTVAHTTLVMQRLLDRPFNIVDARFPGLRRRYEVRPVNNRPPEPWYPLSAHGPLDIHEFIACEKPNGPPIGHVYAWEMETYSYRWNEHAVGVTHIDVAEGHRRQGLARLLLGSVLKHFHDLYFTLVEAHAPADCTAGIALLKGMSFRQVDAGHVYRKALVG